MPTKRDTVRLTEVPVKASRLLITSLCAFALLAGSAPDALAGKKKKKKADKCPSLSLSCFYVRNLGGMFFSTALAQDEEVVLSNVEGAASLVIEEGPIAGSGSSVKPLFLPALSVGLVVKKWRNASLSVEMILAPPNMVNIELQAEGTLANESLAPYALGNIPTLVPPAGPELGTVKALPPMATAVYRPWLDKFFRPYGGLGLAYMIVLGGDITNPVLTSVAEPTLEISHGLGNLGLVAQVGAEAKLFSLAGKNIYLSLDVKYIGFLSLTAVVKDVYVEAEGLPVFGPVKVGDAGASVTVNPLIFQAGLGLDF